MGMRHEIRLSDVENPEAVKIMLDYLYQTDAADWARDAPASQDVNRDVLRLAKQFELSGLTTKAAYWLSRGLTTANVVERLSICDEFDISNLREKIIEALTNDRDALAEIVHSPQLMSYPRLMQAILQRAANSVGSSPDAQKPKSKKARRL